MVVRETLDLDDTPSDLGGNARFTGTDAFVICQTRPARRPPPWSRSGFLRYI
jgi:hypothetical protein